MNKHFVAKYSLSKKLTKYVVRIFYNDIQIIEIYNDNIESLRIETKICCSSINDSNLNQLVKYAED